jgi:hypothetical protein
MHLVFMVYLVLCAGVFIYVGGQFAFEDIFVGPDPKLGYNYKSWWSWIYTMIVSTPFVNLVLLIFIGVLILMRKFK